MQKVRQIQAIITATVVHPENDKQHIPTATFHVYLGSAICKQASKQKVSLYEQFYANITAYSIQQSSKDSKDNFTDCQSNTFT